MENLTAQFLHKIPPPLRNSNIRFLTSLIARPNLTSTSSLRRSSPLSLDCSTPQSTFLLSDIHDNRVFLSSLPRRLSHPGSCPLRLLQEDGDWSKDQFFALIRFLLPHSSRLHQILPVNFKTLYIFKNLSLFSNAAISGVRCVEEARAFANQRG